MVEFLINKSMLLSLISIPQSAEMRLFAAEERMRLPRLLPAKEEVEFK
jgi:hypothetical protein